MSCLKYSDKFGCKPISLFYIIMILCIRYFRKANIHFAKIHFLNNISCCCSFFFLLCQNSLKLTTPDDGPILLDYSKNRINEEVLALLYDLV